jgi:hypothetical protein
VTIRLSTRPAPAPSLPPATDRLERRRQRRQAAERDRCSARLAELHQLRAIVGDAASLVEAGWAHDAWFAYVDESGRTRVAGGLTAHHAEGRPLVAACLVGAVVHAGGGVGAVRTQPVQRALDLLWHTLRRGPDEPVRWCPAPAVRAAHVRDLTAWNDARGRTQAEAAGLLRAAGRLADREIARLRAAG